MGMEEEAPLRVLSRLPSTTLVRKIMLYVYGGWSGTASMV
jgi:hypothetical protein